MTTHVNASWANASATLLAAVEHRRADRRVIACVVAEIVRDADGTAWVVVEHGTASGAAVTPAGVLRAVAAALEAAAAEREAGVQ
jgi:hypothetical protein